jgi:O-methyltransferase
MRRWESGDSPYHDSWQQMVQAPFDRPKFDCREDLYDYLTRSFLADGDALIDYLEFGVYRGDSLRAWCSRNKNPGTRFFGFDSFQGLPEDWKQGRPKGAFTTSGTIPEIADPRVRIVPGWFQQSLPGFLRSYRPAGTLVVHNDCDLYSSTLYCLTRMDPVMSARTLVVFDEFDDILNEYRAFCDYTTAYMRRFKVVAATRHFTQVAVLLL